MQGIERIPDTIGHLVLNEDGAVVTSSGDLENDEQAAEKLMKLIRSAIKIPVTADRPGNFKRLSVLWDDFLYVMTISNHKVFICKRRNLPQEPVMA